MRMIITVLLTLFSLPATAQYSVQRSGELIQLVDSATRTLVSVVPSMGNRVTAMTVNGVNVLYFPYASLDEFKQKPALCGIPLLAPWGNRLDEMAFYANGKKYPFNADLGNVRPPNAIHGFLTYATDWRVIEAKADRQAAWITSRLEVWRQPSSMAQWPFAHNIEITYRLQKGELEVRTSIENLSAEPMPVAIGYHPYFQLTDSPRDDWMISIGARAEYLFAASGRIPSGETQPIEKSFANPQSISLKGLTQDNVYGDLVRDSAGRAVMSVKGKNQKIDVLMGPNYHAAIVFAPNRGAGGQRQGGERGTGGPPTGAGAGAAGAGAGGDRGGAGSTPAGAAPQAQAYICFEPMAGITDALNLAHKGLYKELQIIPGGGVWQESFWVRPSGF
jgi:aldose 1-epimerase